eukprot:m.24077 g.24077  ORF g.24077 m.24077 type:complete len:67 (+) comp14470_c0_seq1:60-260(+)
MVMLGVGVNDVDLSRCDDGGRGSTNSVQTLKVFDCQVHVCTCMHTWFAGEQMRVGGGGGYMHSVWV